MLIDLLATSNYISFNSVLANIVGLKEAIYISEIMNINEKAIRKKVDSNGYFGLDREYFKNRTTITPKEQEDIEEKLSEVGIVEKNNDTIRINVNTLTAILMSSDEQLVGALKPVKKTKKLTKEEAVILNLRKSVLVENEELKNAYYAWIDSVCAKDGWMSKTAITSAQKKIDEFTNRDLDIALCILQIASINGWRDISWAIERYTKNMSLNVNVANNQTYVKQTNNVGMSEEAF